MTLVAPLVVFAVVCLTKENFFISGYKYTYRIIPVVLFLLTK